MERDDAGRHEERGKSHGGEQEGSGRGTRNRTGDGGIRFATLGRCAGDDDDRHDHARHARDRPGDRDASELRRTADAPLHVAENGPDPRREVQEHEAREEHRERADAALPLIVVRPVRPVLIRRAIVGRVAAAHEPSDQEEKGKEDAREGERPRCRSAGVRRLHDRASSDGRSASPS